MTTTMTLDPQLQPVDGDFATVTTTAGRGNPDQAREAMFRQAAMVPPREEAAILDVPEVQAMFADARSAIDEFRRS